MSLVLSPPPRYQAIDQDGNPVSGGKVYTYAAGTSTPLATYTSVAGTVENSNPIILDTAGRAVIYLTSGTDYKFVVTDADDVAVYTQDHVKGIGSETGQFVESVTGLNTNNADPVNPIVRISVDGTTITGLGTPGSPLVASGGSGKQFAFLNLGSGTSFAVNWALASWFKISPTNDFSISFSNTPGSAECDNIIIEIDGASGFDLTLPAGGTWGALGEPEFSSASDLVTVGMRDGSSISYWMLAFPGPI